MLEIYFLVVGIVFLISEISVYKLVLSVNKKFQWLILEKDENPQISESVLEKFLPHGYDAELGWVRKPNTEHFENGKDGKVKWTTNNSGARAVNCPDPGFTLKLIVPSGVKQKTYKSFCINPPSPVVNKSRALFLSTLTNATARSNKAIASSLVPKSFAKEVTLRKLEHTAVTSSVFRVLTVFFSPI